MKKKIKCFCTHNRSQDVYDGKLIFLLFQNKDFLMMNLTDLTLSFCGFRLGKRHQS